MNLKRQAYASHHFKSVFECALTPHTLVTPRRPSSPPPFFGGSASICGTAAPAQHVSSGPGAVEGSRGRLRDGRTRHMAFSLQPRTHVSPAVFLCPLRSCHRRRTRTRVDPSPA